MYKKYEEAINQGEVFESQGDYGIFVSVNQNSLQGANLAAAQDQIADLEEKVSFC